MTTVEFVVVVVWFGCCFVCLFCTRQNRCSIFLIISIEISGKSNHQERLGFKVEMEPQNNPAVITRLCKVATTKGTLVLETDSILVFSNHIAEESALLFAFSL